MGAPTAGYEALDALFVNAYRQADVPQPAGMFAFIDHHEDSLLGGGFEIWESPSTSASQLPANRHGKGMNLSFLDGHVERKRWKGLWGTRPILRDQVLAGSRFEPAGEDYYWLWGRATTKREP